MSRLHSYKAVTALPGPTWGSWVQAWGRWCTATESPAQWWSATGASREQRPGLGSTSDTAAYTHVVRVKRVTKHTTPHCKKKKWLYGWWCQSVCLLVIYCASGTDVHGVIEDEKWLCVSLTFHRMQLAGQIFTFQWNISTSIWWIDKVLHHWHFSLAVVMLVS